VIYSKTENGKRRPVYGLEEESHEQRRELAGAVKAMPKPSAALSTIDKVRDVLARRQCSRVDGIVLDTFSASMIIKVYEACPPEKKAKFEALPIRKMFHVACKAFG
jgi:hypothetical protein